MPNPSDPPAIVILAAGKGARMDSDLPKVLHPLGQVPMLHHALAAASALDPARIVVVTGYGADAVTKAARAYLPEVSIAHQTEQLGTGHAVLTARDALDGCDGKIIVLYGDTPFVTPQTLLALADAPTDVTVLGFEAADPRGYGRLVTQNGHLDKIVEEQDATADDEQITLCNSGVMAANATQLFNLLDAVDNSNSAAEYYLTDIVGLARARGLSAGVVRCHEAETRGINTVQQLATAEAQFQAQARAKLIADGVAMAAPDTVYLAQDTAIGRGASIEPYVVFAPGVTVESGATIRAFSHLEGAHVARGAVVGPYARLRPGAELAEDARIGNFVEVKNAQIDAGAKVNHLSYIGDASIGAAANIGAGSITCNYDGALKHHTTIGAGAFIGSGTLLVAPVEVGDSAYTGSGSVITEDVSAGDLAIARARQVTKKGLGARLMARLKSLKSKQKAD
ncbi:MAG: bifunctional UDP-N-acetylglucosamine diphosphorylase/glucosamine-1-phosphate N-acetyltransferase GlmU [Pseudomonadota bacterium]